MKKWILYFTLFYFPVLAFGQNGTNLFQKIKASDGVKVDSIALTLLEIYLDEALINEVDSVLWLNYELLSEREIASSHYQKALFYAREALKYAINLKDIKRQAKLYSDISLILDEMGKYPEALDMSYKSLALYKKINDSSGIAYCYNDIGIFDYYLEDYDRGKEVLLEALAIFESLKDTVGISFCYNNIANIVSDQGNYRASLEWYEKGLALDVARNNKLGQSISYTNTGETYIELGEFSRAEEDLKKAVGLAMENEQEWHKIAPIQGLALLYNRMGDFDKSIILLHSAQGIAEKINAKGELIDIYELMYKNYEGLFDYENAFRFLSLYRKTEKEVFNTENAALIKELEARYDIEKKDFQLDQLSKDKALAELQHEKDVKDKELSYGLAIVALIILLLVSWLLIAKRKANNKLYKQKVYIEDQNGRLNHALLELEEKNKEITDSINYAEKIQKAILPELNVFSKWFADFFVLYRPKDIVAGDFYWIQQVNDYLYFAVADCTGHGVPGALVSVVCHNALNRAILEFNKSTPSEILDKVTELVCEQFKGAENSMHDGMDIVLCRYQVSNNELIFSGANNPLWVVSPTGALKEYKGDKQYVGSVYAFSKFNNHRVQVESGDVLYLSSDGFQDQFGGSKNKKFKSSNFKKLLSNGAGLSLKEQQDKIVNALENWKGENEQVDDICVLGIRVFQNNSL